MTVCTMDVKSIDTNKFYRISLWSQSVPVHIKMVNPVQKIVEGEGGEEEEEEEEEKVKRTVVMILE